jgi:acyl carrier protein
VPEMPSESVVYVQERVFAAIAEKIGRPTDAIQLEDDLLADLGMDSLAMAELTVLIDQLAGQTLPGEELIQANTVGDLVQLISEHSKVSPQVAT